eukprot:365314-Chlamydomonas_euryale.AAC.8
MRCKRGAKTQQWLLDSALCDALLAHHADIFCNILKSRQWLPSAHPPTAIMRANLSTYSVSFLALKQ